jgi:hypothetical protein
VYYFLTESIKKRMIMELRRFWQYDPNYRDHLVKNIQGKYSFRKRPQMGIIVKNSSANPLALAADNFQGTISSYAVLNKVGNNPGLSIEWITENGLAIANNGGTFPTLPGVYYIAVEQETVDIGGQPQDRLVFYVDPLLNVIDETPLQLDDFTWQVNSGKFHEGSLRLFEMPGGLTMVEGTNYTADPETGTITLVSPVPNGTWLSADYRYPVESSGPYLIRYNHTNVAAIPGVTLAFGRRVEAGDRLAILVSDRREPVALEYGGRWEISLDIDIMARDVHAQTEITDRTLMYLWGVAKSRLSSEGIEITNVSHGGESEEQYDETGDDYFYNASLSVTVLTDWAIRVPLGATIQRALPQTLEQSQAAAGLSDEELIGQEPNQMQVVQDLNLIRVADPFFVGRNKTYEKIS